MIEIYAVDKLRDTRSPGIQSRLHKAASWGLVYLFCIQTDYPDSYLLYACFTEPGKQGVSTTPNAYLGLHSTRLQVISFDDAASRSIKNETGINVPEHEDSFPCFNPPNPRSPLCRVPRLILTSPHGEDRGIRTTACNVPTYQDCNPS